MLGHSAEIMTIQEYVKETLKRLIKRQADKQLKRVAVKTRMIKTSTEDNLHSKTKGLQKGLQCFYTIKYQKIFLLIKTANFFNTAALPQQPFLRLHI